MFTEIKVLGVPTSVKQVTVSQNGKQNGAEQTVALSHTMDYNDAKKVRCHLQGNATFTTPYVLLNLWRFSSQL